MSHPDEHANLPIATRGSRYKAHIRPLIIGTGAFIATFDVTAVSLALPSISQTFTLDVVGYVWVMDAYSLAFTITLITAGAVTDRYGQRLTMVAGAVLFLVASALCGSATHFGTLITGRVLQGAGAAFVICGGFAMTSRLYTQKAQRVQAFGIIGTVAGTALALGPPLGGFIATVWGWQWVFLINIPVCLTIIVASLLWMDEYTTGRHERLDVPGILLVSILLLISTWSLLHGPAVAGLGFRIPAIGTALVLLLAAFIWVEMTSPYPAVDISLFRNRAFVGLAMVPLSLSLSYWSLIVFMPMFLGSSLRVSPQFLSYVMLFFTLPMFAVPLLLANARVARIAAAISPSLYYSTGLFIVSFGCSLLAWGSYASDYVSAGAGMIVAGIGAAAMQSQVSGALIATAPQDRAGNVSAIMTVLRQGGFAIACAFLTKVMDARLDLGSYLVERFTLVFLVCAVVAGIGALCTLRLTQNRAGPTRAVLDPNGR